MLPLTISAYPLERKTRVKYILHLGTEKTGSIFLQKWLCENESALSNRGAALTKTARFPSNTLLPLCFKGEIDDFMQRQGVLTEKECVDFFLGFFGPAWS